MADCIDNIGQAKDATKFDHLKGLWQTPLTDRAKGISAFLTPDGLYQYQCMPFGMKNSPATFQRRPNNISAACSAKRMTDLCEEDSKDRRQVLLVVFL